MIQFFISFLILLGTEEYQPPVHMYFSHNTSEFSCQSDSTFNDLEYLRSEYPNIKIEIKGYRNKNESKIVSFKRADGVKQKLIKMGWSINSMTIKDMGTTQAFNEETSSVISINNEHLDALMKNRIVKFMALEY